MVYLDNTTYYFSKNWPYIIHERMHSKKQFLTFQLNQRNKHSQSPFRFKFILTTWFFIMYIFEFFVLKWTWSYETIYAKCYSYLHSVEIIFNSLILYAWVIWILIPLSTFLFEWSMKIKKKCWLAYNQYA